MWGLLIAIISGALMSVQGVFNTGLTKQTSVWTAASFVQFSALIVCIVAWFISGKESGFLDVFKIDHKYQLLGGCLGAFITITVIKAMSDLGPAKATLLIVISQLTISYIVELFGMFGVDKQQFEWRKLFGIAIAVGGIILFKYK